MGDRENKKILLVDIKKCRITEKLKDACISMGFEKSNIFVTSEAEAEDFSDFFEYYYVTAGNTFEILKEIRIIGHCPYLMGQLFLIIQKQISDVTLKIQILMFLQDMTKYIQ